MPANTVGWIKTIFCEKKIIVQKELRGLLVYIYVPSCYINIIRTKMKKN